MFWSHTHNETLRDELRLRLRVAADFATLGAYELSEADDLPAEHPIREQPPQRVFVFAKVAPVCPHSATVEPGCTTERRPTWARSRRTSARRQRGGAVRVPDQPCMCAAERVPSR